MTTLYYATGNELYHHGVKGMKWGRRRYQLPDGTLTAEGRNRYQSKREAKYTKKGMDKKTAVAKAKRDTKRKMTKDQFTRDRNFQNVERSVGARVATNLIAGPFANRTYNSVIAAGGTKNMARATTFASAYLGGPIGHLAVSAIIKEYDVDRQMKAN